MAEQANVTAAWLSAVKNDRIKNPPIDKLRAIARICRVPLRFLTEPMGVVPIEEVAAGSEPLTEGLTDADRELVTQLAQRLREARAEDPPETETRAASSSS